MQAENMAPGRRGIATAPISVYGARSRIERIRSRPRAETELLASHAIAMLRETGGAAPLVIDMCCGSGNVGLAIAHAVKSATLLSADLTEEHGGDRQDQCISPGAF